jgi:hypothetical protein
MRAHRPRRPRPLPKITEAEAAALICGRWRQADGTPIGEDRAARWTLLFFYHLRCEPTPDRLPPRPRTRPGRPTAERLEAFLALETDWVRITPDDRPVRRRRPEGPAAPRGPEPPMRQSRDGDQDA